MKSHREQLHLTIGVNAPVIRHSMRPDIGNTLFWILQVLTFSSQFRLIKRFHRWQNSTKSEAVSCVMSRKNKIQCTDFRERIGLIPSARRGLQGYMIWDMIWTFNKNKYTSRVKYFVNCLIIRIFRNLADRIWGYVCLNVIIKCQVSYRHQRSDQRSWPSILKTELHKSRVPCTPLLY